MKAFILTILIGIVGFGAPSEARTLEPVDIRDVMVDPSQLIPQIPQRAQRQTDERRALEARASEACDDCLVQPITRIPVETIAPVVEVATSQPARSERPQSPAAETAKPSRTGFIQPVGGRLSSRFGMRRHPIKRKVRMHNGVDFSQNKGAAVKASAGGKVIESVSSCPNRSNSCNGGEGNVVKIDHGNGIVTEYMHLAPNCSLPRTGQTVQQGQKIGCVGRSGLSSGYHLHFGAKKNGRYIDPLTLLRRK